MPEIFNLICSLPCCSIEKVAELRGNEDAPWCNQGGGFDLAGDTGWPGRWGSTLQCLAIVYVMTKILAFVTWPGHQEHVSIK
jgi:hypothetical protein